MLSVFKGYKILFTVICSIYLIALLALTLSPDMNFILSTVLCVSYPLFIFAASIFINKRINKKMNNYQKILDEDCDSVKYCEIYEDLIKRDKKRNCRFLLDMNYGVGLNANGSKKAIEITSALTRDPLFARVPEMTRMITYNNLTVYLMHAGEYGDAERCAQKSLEYINSALSKNVRNEKLVQMLEYLKDGRELDLEMLHGDNSRAESVRRKSIETAVCMRVKVDSYFDLGLYYRSVGNTEGEIECMKFVAENGNTMFIAKKAAERLKTLEDNI